MLNTSMPQQLHMCDCHSRNTQPFDGDRTAQVAINWTICKGALPIPGAKNARQAKEAAGVDDSTLTYRGQPCKNVV
jgi:aryl-alcohol dehydrogenase-like predicted oxidoreductase